MTGWILVLMLANVQTAAINTTVFANQISCESAGQQFLKAFRNPNENGAYYICASQTKN